MATLTTDVPREHGYPRERADYPSGVGTDPTDDDERPRIAHSTLLACGRAPCSEHGEACAYHGDEDGRCVWCHATWQGMAATFRAGWIDSKGRRRDYAWREVHSCERSKPWGQEQAPWRKAKAVQMRECGVGAVSARDTAPHCGHVGKDATHDPTGLRIAESSLLGTAELIEVECTRCHRVSGVMVETLAFAACRGCGGAVRSTGRKRRDWNEYR